jgi:hypothetical protein
VLAVGRERHVVGAQGAAGANLCALLAQQRSPQPEFALPLQGDCLGVDAADEHQVAVERLDLVVGYVERVVRMLDAFAFGSKELDHVRLRRNSMQTCGHADAPLVGAPIAGSPRRAAWR